MKNGLAVLARYIFSFLGIEIFAILIFAAVRLSDISLGAAPFTLSLWAGYAVESLPPAVAVAVFTAGFSATRKLRYRLSGYFLIFTLSFAILGGGLYLSKKLSLSPGVFYAKSVESGHSASRLPYFVREASGAEAKGIVYARSAEEVPRLTWAQKGTYIPDRGILLVDRTALALPATGPGAFPTSIGGLSDFQAWYLDLRKNDLFLEAIAVAGIAGLFCGLWPLSRLFRWPLIGACASGAALVSLGTLCALFRSPTVRDLASMIGLKGPDPLLMGIMTGACGLALVLLDFALRPALGGASARRKRGRS